MYIHIHIPFDRNQVPTILHKKMTKSALLWAAVIILTFLSSENKLVLWSGYAQFSNKKISVNGIRGWHRE